MLPSYLVSAFLVSFVASGEPQVRITLDDSRQHVTYLSWDTEGGNHCERNLLRADKGAVVELESDGKWLPLDSRGILSVQTRGDGFDLRVSFHQRQVENSQRARINFAFDAGVTPTSVLPTAIEPDGAFRFPVIVSSPDFGQMLVDVSSAGEAKSRLIGDRPKKTLDWIVEVPWTRDGLEVLLVFRPVRLPTPKGSQDDARWRLARRAWFNALNLTSQWGDQKARFSAPVGILGNNVLSDPASCSLWMYADMAMFVPEMPGGIKTAPFLRRSLDHWLDNRMRPNGNVIGYWDYDEFIDSPASMLISAWDYIEMSGDKAWLTDRIPLLERIADYALSRDIDGDGLIEAVPSGNLGSLKQPKRSSCWFDAINFGHKDAYANALTYRGFRCMADLETRLKREDHARKYTDAAKKLKKAYTPALLNPATGWIAMWRSQDGQLHDYACPFISGYAIEYGLVDHEAGKRIVDKLHAKIDAAGFTRFDLGLPCILDPIRPGDYLQPAIGAPQTKDGRDTWQIYMNGGTTAGHVYHYLAAHYVVGMNEPADRLLDTMLKAAAAGRFQNGVRDQFPAGIDWTKWNGEPCGYEGFLADNWRFLLAVLTRQKEYRDRLYRPLAD
jgi:hypothetical protein